MAMRGRTGRTLALTLAILAGAVWTAEAGEPTLASPWVTEQSARVRLVAGGVTAPDGAARLYAGLEIMLEDGWKTYWRNPGSSGVPPRIETEGSTNIASANLLFPAPIRFKDRDGDTIGYKHRVILPLLIEPKDASQPIDLKVLAEFGICREICIPVQPTLTLSLPAETRAVPAGDALEHFVASVPRAEPTKAGDPRLERVEIELSGPKPRISIRARIPGEAAKADVFLEAPDGIWIPPAKPAGVGPDGMHRFDVDLSDGADIADLKGRTVRATLVGGEGAAEARFKVE